MPPASEGDGGGAAGAIVVDDAEIALCLNRQGLLDEEAHDGLAGDTGGEDGASRLPNLAGAFGEADGAGPGASAGADLSLDDDAGTELRRGGDRLGGGLSEEPAWGLEAGAPGRAPWPRARRDARCARLRLGPVHVSWRVS